METYTFLRELADSWVLLAMTGFYIAAILWVFRPGAKAHYQELSHLPLREDPKARCAQACANCACATPTEEGENV